MWPAPSQCGSSRESSVHQVTGCGTDPNSGVFTKLRNCYLLYRNDIESYEYAAEDFVPILPKEEDSLVGV